MATTIIVDSRNLSENDVPKHPKGSRARVLLSSVFGPYARDDEYGSRAINPMELYHNQVTRTQGPFSLRMFHRSWGLMIIQSNIDAPCALLDFPTLDRFISEIRDNEYDIVGIGGILPNFLKVKIMCDLVREHLPEAVVVVGGHVANIPDLGDRIDADIIVRGEGVAFFRGFLGEDATKPFNHPLIQSGVGTRVLGVDIKEGRGDVAATLIPSVGCPMGCNFCSTSAMFGGKGKFVNFYDTGDELFDVMLGIEKEMSVQSFFVMDENFLLHRKRALRLLELMEEHGKPWSLNVFSSAAVIRKYSMDQLVRLGISWVWMGLEGEDSAYDKLEGVDSFALVDELHEHGIRILGSSIIGLENHTPENIDSVIDHAVKYNTDFHQFMLYTPAPGTPLCAELTEKGVMKSEEEFPLCDTHGQLAFNYRHPHICGGEETEFLLRAFNRDFEVNGPSVMRIADTLMRGWKRYKNSPDARIRKRYERETRKLATTYPAVLKAITLFFDEGTPARGKAASLLKEIHAEFGLKSRVSSFFGGRLLLGKIKKEERRLAEGATFEPPTFYEKNHIDEATDRKTFPATQCRYVVPSAPRS